MPTGNNNNSSRESRLMYQAKGRSKDLVVPPSACLLPQALLLNQVPQASDDQLKRVSRLKKYRLCPIQTFLRLLQSTGSTLG